MEFTHVKVQLLWMIIFTKFFTVQFLVTSIVTFSKGSAISNFSDVNRFSSKIYIFCYIFIILCFLFHTFVFLFFIFLTQKIKIPQIFPFVLRNYLIFVCYKVTRKLSFLIFKYELFYTDFFNINKKN